MTLRALPAALLLSTGAILSGSPGARSEVLPLDPAVTAPSTAAPSVQLAQNFTVQPVDKNKDKDGKGKKPPEKKPPQKEGAPPPNAGQQYQMQQGKENAQKQKQLQIQQAKERAQQQKQQADQARQNAIKQKQLEMQQAKDRAQKAKQDADAARQNALKQKQFDMQQAKDKAQKAKQDADAARDNAVKQKQFDVQQARDKALKQKQDADAARDNALKQQQFEAQQARDRALKQKQDADAARDNALKQKQFDLQQAKDREQKQKQFDLQRRDAAGAAPRGGIQFNRAKTDQEFQRARERAQREQAGRDGRGGDFEKWRSGSDKKFEALRKERKTREVGNRNFIIEPDKRVIVRKDNRTYIRHDESQRLNRVGRELRRERRKNGTLMVVTMGLAGALIYSLQDDEGRVLRRTRRDHDGREIVLLDNRRYYGRGDYSPFGPERYYDSYVDLPPPRIHIPREKYIVEYDQASPDDIYDALNAPPVDDIGRGYSLDEVRRSYPVLERMRRVDLDSINFDFGSWDVGPDQYRKLERIARAMQRILDRSPGEIFLIEGHTDAVGSEIDNLSLSDRRAESVAVILSESFSIPPENLTTQGYGEEHLKVLTEDPSRINRRVSVRRITPLLSREGWNDPD
ncbi:OmpA family protein [Hyphomicrobium sp.]|uniref:OmpA family protein n=1 Tax=Hyphomicrobium sp. TaxID=82 RepID=UPI002E31C81B|nr:OmpA family protein [Hyphomicrobium sp.]HEX2840501.1 OmpA family protein [Hyphomicrobium sp.]